MDLGQKASHLISLGQPVPPSSLRSVPVGEPASRSSSRGEPAERSSSRASRGEPAERSSSREITRIALNEPWTDRGSYSEVKQEDTDGRLYELAFATTTIGITERDGGTCKVEESVYGAALVMPQLARTVGWNKTLTTLAMRSFLFLCLNIFLQAYLLKLIAKEQLVLDSFSGQMHLCDFGLDYCPGPGCRGPSGTALQPARLYGWSDIVSRNFVKQSLKDLFPERNEEIDEKVDPGEYGMESTTCRYMCCFIFMISCLDELVRIGSTVHLLYRIPNKSEPWIQPRSDVDGPPTGALEDVRLTIAGMSCMWKFINIMFILVPKIALWKLTIETGTTFLMETASISDLIVNCVALALILGLDELIMTSLMHEEERRLVSSIEEFEFYDAKVSCVGDMSVLTEDELMDRYKENQFGLRSWGFEDLGRLLPVKLFLAVLLTWLCVLQYYSTFCTSDKEEGSHRFVSKPMHMPASLAFDWWNAFLPRLFPVQFQEETYWEMPSN